MDPALVLPADDNLSLSAKGYNGINLGDSITNNERLRLTNIENDEGSFSGYKLMHKELGAVGYVVEGGAAASGGGLLGVTTHLRGGGCILASQNPRENYCGRATPGPPRS